VEWATNLTLYIPSSSAADAGYYSAIVSNAAGMVSNLVAEVRVQPTTNSLYTAIYTTLPTPEPWIAAGANGTLLTSSNSLNWTLRALPVTNNITGLSQGSNLLVACTSSGQTLVSSNGLTWTTNLFTGSFLWGIAYGGGKYVAVGPYNWQYSSDGRNWTFGYAGTRVYQSVTYGNGYFVAATADGPIGHSSNGGQSWTHSASGTSERLLSVTFGTNVFVAVGRKGVITTASVPGPWTVRESGVAVDLFHVTYANGLFHAFGDKGVCLVSPDGLDWSRLDTGTTDRVLASAWGEGRLLSFGEMETPDDGMDRLVALLTDSFPILSGGASIRDVPALGVHHFALSTPTNGQVAGTAFSAILTAQDVFNRTVTNFSGGVRLFATQSPGVPNLRANYFSPSMDTLRKAWDAKDNGDHTLGMIHTVTNPITVYQLNAAFGSKMTVWGADQTPLISQSFRGLAGRFTAVPLSEPVVLPPGNYITGSYTDGGTSYKYTGFPSGPAVYGVSDSFPSTDNGGRWPFVSFTYANGAAVGHPVQPVTANGFVNGVWSGSVNIPNPGTNIILQALSADGVSGYSSPIQVSGVPTVSPVRFTQTSFGYADSFNGSMTVNGGQQVIVDISTNLVNWFPISTNRSSDGVVNFFDIGVDSLPVRFYRARLIP
jgi:hypothetical protein